MTTGAIVAVTIEGADQGDTTTLRKTLAQAKTQITRVQKKTGACHPGGLQEVVADKGYHSTPVLQELEAAALRGYISEPDRGRRKWRGDLSSRDTVYANRRRNRGQRGLRLHRARGERAERPFAHLYRTGRMRRTHLRGQENILKRVLLHSGAFNLGLLIRQSLSGRDAERPAGPSPCPSQPSHSLLATIADPLDASWAPQPPLYLSLAPRLHHPAWPGRSGFHHGLLGRPPRSRNLQDASVVERRLLRIEVGSFHTAISSGSPIELVQVAFATSTVSPTAGNLPLAPTSRVAESLQATS